MSAHQDWTAWGDSDSQKISLPTAAGSYYLTDNITLSTEWLVNNNVNLCLNGHYINQTGESQRVIHVSDGITLNLTDCNKNIVHEGYLDSDGLWNLGTPVSGSTPKNIEGGVITGGSADIGGGVYLESGTFHMSGGTIAGNTAEEKGGGVYINEEAQWVVTFDPETGRPQITLIDPYMKVSGTVTIEDNIVGTKPNNVFLVAGAGNIDGWKITVSGSLSGGHIGITTQDSPTDTKPIRITYENDKDWYRYFFSDNETYGIKNIESNGKHVLYLSIKDILSWDFDEGTPTGTYTPAGAVNYGYTIDYPDSMNRDGYTFEGWTPNPSTMPAESITIKAVWSPVPEPENPEPENPEPEPENTNSEESTGSSVWLQDEPYSVYTSALENGGTVILQDETFYQVVMPQGYVGDVVLTTKTDTENMGFDLYENVDISVSNSMLSDEFAVIKCKIALSIVEARGFTAADVGIYHFENGTWVKLETVYEVRDGIVYVEAKTNAFSPFALGFEKGGDFAPTDIPLTNPTETPASPVPILGILAGLGLCIAVLRRR